MARKVIYLINFTYMNRTSAFSIGVAFSAVAIGVMLAVPVFAWTGPTQSAPSGNVTAPINVGTSDQVKDGGLSVTGLSVYPSWSPAQAVAINGNQIWKSVTTGDDTLYFQYSCEGCPVQIGDNSGAANDLLVYGSTGIGISPSQKLDVNGYIRVRSTNSEGGTIQLDGDNGTTMWVENQNGKFRLMDSPWSTELFSVDQSGNGWTAGSMTAGSFLYSSDARLKTGIRSLQDAKRILELDPKTFVWKSTGEEDIGIIAQDVEKLFPEFVHETSNGYKAVDYPKLVVPLLRVVADQQRQIDELTKRVEKIEQK